MSNIINSGAQNSNSATAPTPRVNEQPVGVSKGRNVFDLSYDNYLTQQFGKIFPFFQYQAYENDTLKFASRHEVRSYTMSAPWMGQAMLNKHYFAVPYNAILRRNWTYIYTQPEKGDDIPDDANCTTTYVNGSYGVSAMLDNILSFIKFKPGTSATLTAAQLTAWVKCMFLAESILSNGSLLAMLGVKLGPYVYIQSSSGERWTFDEFVQHQVEKLVGESFTIVDGSRQLRVDDYGLPFILDYMRDNSTWNFGSVPTGITATSWLEAGSFSAPVTLTDIPFNFQYLLAYQCICSQFYTNDHVDNLYTWQLFEEAAQTCALAVLPNGVMPTFERNSVKHLYDVFSGHIFNAMISAVETVSETSLSVNTNALAYLQYIFNFRRSLIFSDYFRGSKTTPLAAVNVNAPVVGSNVSAVDITKSIIRQRFANAVQKAGQRFNDYVSKVTGGSVSPDYHEPKWICGSRFILGSNEIENTSENQGNVVQNIRTSADKWEFETSFGMPSIVLGLAYFNTPTVYAYGVRRDTLQVNRFDYFNVRFQNIGDQPVYQCELYALGTTPFAYQTRNAEFKQSLNVASGGFIRDLPAWAYIPDSTNPRLTIGSSYVYNNIDSEFIRDVPTDFDRFYSSLTGYSLANRFHMIFKFHNSVTAYRNMQITPSIL